MEKRAGVLASVLGLTILTLAACQQQAAAPAAPKEAAPPAGAPALLGPPGNGVVLCPGNKSCPELDLVGRFGAYVPKADIDVGKPPRRLLCPGDLNCPKGPDGTVYVGWLIAVDATRTETNGEEDWTWSNGAGFALCRPGDKKPGCEHGGWSFTCTDRTKVCPVWPELPETTTTP